MISRKEANVFLIYYGFLLLLLSMVMPPLSSSLHLSETPQTFGFEDDWGSVSAVFGSPLIVTSAVASGSKAVKCQNGDYVLWDLATPSRTLNLTFKIYWTKLPIIANESLIIGEIWNKDTAGWHDILVSRLYCDQTDYRGWSLWTSIPNGRVAAISGDAVYTLQTNRWYTIGMTADLNKGSYSIYLDGSEIASITEVVVPADVYISFFRLGTSERGDSVFTIYYDEVTASLLEGSPSPEQWSASTLAAQLIGIGMILLGGFLWLSGKKKNRTVEE